METKKNIIKILLRLIFLCVPTIAVAAFALKNANEYYAVLENNWISQTIYFGIGIFVSCILFGTRLRFIPITLIVLLAFYIIQNIIAGREMQEFDVFFHLVHFRIFSVLFLLGWICGWGFSRFKNFSIILAACLVATAVILAVSVSDFSFQGILKIFVPIVIFAVYIIYMSAAIRNMSEFSRGKFFTFLLNLCGILLLFFALISLVATSMKPTFSAIEQQWSTKEKDSEFDGLLDKGGPDSTFRVKNKMRPTPQFTSKKDKPEPVFAAYIDNYLDEEKEIPNPFYFVSNYLTNFDTYTETFEFDSVSNMNKLFSPDPSQIDLYFNQTDTVLMHEAQQYENTIELPVDVYKINLSPKQFLAPQTGFFCQPISLEASYKKQFKSAYRAKSIVSTLNSAYFVYPSRDPMMLAYQQQRYDILSKDENFDEVPEQFYRYYTSLPSSSFIDSVRNLTNKITENAQTPVEKILAIRDFFFAEDEYGNGVFDYTENPGIPGIPSQSKLANFLFVTHKGYCAHYAGATLFMLRACGIPARLTIGFLLVDRSDKNKGWYWVYEDQAHAWVQFYLPHFGWLDFDTTIGNNEVEESPQPDGTPPMQISKADFAGSGKVKSVDTAAKTMQVELTKVIINDNEIQFDNPYEITLDLSKSKITRDSSSIDIKDVKEGETALSLSFDEKIKDLQLSPDLTKEDIMRMLPKPMPIDEFKIDTQKKDEEKKDDEKTKNNELLLHSDKDAMPQWLLWLIVAAAIVLVVLSIPYIIFRYYRAKSKFKTKKVNAFYVYKTSMFLLNQMKCERGNLTPLRYSSSVVDAKYQTEFEKFMIIYLQMKYADTQISEKDKSFICEFYRNFEKQIKKKHKLTQRIKQFLNIKQTIKFYTNNYGTAKRNG